ncbi:hypothetical protein ACR79Q_24535 [Sphingobacterium multivorum]|uniref:hypothetical protein n=1 Tax=Sphingobacterium multivorum TaxID=28454 RepID=UPI003DA23F82
MVQNNGLGTNLSKLIGELEQKLYAIAIELITKESSDADVNHIIDFLKPIVNISDKRNSVITSLLIALGKFKEKILINLSIQYEGEINYILARFAHVLEAFKAGNIFIFQKGEIEHYYTQTVIDYLSFSDKDKNTSFHAERDFILSSTTSAEIETNYGELISILKASVPQIKVDLSKHLKFQIVEWLQTVQRAIGYNGDIDPSAGHTDPSV